MKKRRILAIDGGGVRGIVAAVILDALDRELQRQGWRKPFSDAFDLIAGTSTGAILAAGLSVPNGSGTGPKLAPSDIRRLYRERSIEIFPSRFWCRLPLFGRLRQFFGPLYAPGPLINVLSDELGDSDFSMLYNNLLISAYAIDPREAAFFRGGPDYLNHTLPPEVTPPATGVKVIDAVTGSASAPTFFPPHRVLNDRTGQTQTLIDGGVFLNDPSLLALAEAVMLYPDDDVHVISIGTGRIIEPYPFRLAKGWGFFEWLSPIGRFRTPLISIVADGQARAVNAQMKKLLGDRYHRFDYDLARGYGSANLDDASPRNLTLLEEGAEKMAKEMQAQLEEVAALLMDTSS